LLNLILASKNIRIIFGRFPNEFCSINKFGKYSAKKYLKKKFVKTKLLEFNSKTPKIA